jgi:hypothetical protein
VSGFDRPKEANVAFLRVISISALAMYLGGGAWPANKPEDVVMVDPNGAWGVSGYFIR